MKLKTRNALAGYLLALPFLIGFAGFYLIPFLWSIRFTFTSGSGGTAFVGLGANSARLRVPAEEHRELVFRAIDAIDRGEPGPGAQ